MNTLSMSCFLLNAPLNVTAITFFLIFVGITLIITFFSRRIARSRSGFYTAGGNISGLNNGLAIAGDYMSAASFLGITALVFSNGFDGLVYAIGFLVGWPVVMFLIAEKFRNLGRYTFSDIVAFRLKQTPVRTISAISGLFVVIFYLIAQMVGAGQLVELLFGLKYTTAVVCVGALMVLYVYIGGMHATTWVQIIKACLLLFGVSLMAFLILYETNFEITASFETAIRQHAKHDAIMAPGAFLPDPISALSLGLALMFGTAGLPHILMRFFTVKNAKEARKSVFWGTLFIGYFYMLIFIIGFGAIVFLLKDGSSYVDASGKLIGGNNMVAIMLAEALGGNGLLGFISAVAFATILAVVSGLTISGTSAIAHDLYAQVLHKGKADPKKELRVGRITTIVLGVLAILLGIIFEKQNVAFMVGLAFAIAASVNFPILILSIYWKGLTTKGVFWGGLLGLIVVITLSVLSPKIWVDSLGFQQALFKYNSPALFSIPFTFIMVMLISKLDKSPQANKDKAGFAEQHFRAESGIGANTDSTH